MNARQAEPWAAWAAALVLAFGSLAGCATGLKLKTAPSAETVGANGAVDEVDGARVVAQPVSIVGVQSVTDEVTPIEVRIENGSQQPIRVRYEDFGLVTGAGDRYAALPLVGIEGVAQDWHPSPGHPVVGSPLFFHDGFYVAPHFAPVFPTLAPYAHPFLVDPLYYDEFYGYWQPTRLPTDAMIERALPEGVLEPDGTVSGLLYFEKVPNDVRRVTFRAELMNAKTGDAIGEATIPFVPER